MKKTIARFSGLFLLLITFHTAPLYAQHTSRADIVDTAIAAGSFNTLATALTEADLVGALKGKGPFTVFAPTDEAFAKLPKETLTALLKPENRDQLQQILKYHVVKGRVYSDSFFRNRTIATLVDERLRPGFDNGGFVVNNASVVQSDIEASNGVIHVIDTVLLPADETLSSSAAGNLMRLAIKRGVPLFNRGQKAACAAVYEVAAVSVVASPDVSDAAKAPLKRALASIKNEHDAGRQAWALREAIDDSLNEIEAAEMMANR